MLHKTLISFMLVSWSLSLAGADEAAPLKIHMLSGSKEYKSEPSLKKLQKHLEQSYRVEVTASWVKDGATDLPGIEHIPKADLLIVFARRMKLPEKQMQIVRKHWESGKPMIGIRTASHAFGNADNEIFDRKVMGGNYKGHYGSEEVQVHPAPMNKSHPVLDGVGEFVSSKLYKAGPLAEDVTLLQMGTIEKKKITQSVTWTHSFKGGRTFYTSLGVPSDFDNEHFLRMIENAVFWTTNRDRAKLRLAKANSRGARKVPLEKRLLEEGTDSLAKAVMADGDARRGAKLFYQPATACTKCHSTGKGQSPLGPDLAKLGKETKLAHLIESVLEPSKIIKKDYQAVQVVTGDGQAVVGFVVSEKPDALVLRDAVNLGKVVTISKDDIESREVSKVSVMPIGVVNQLKERQSFLDLVRYLEAITQHGPAMARRLEPDDYELRLLSAESIDHAQQIQSLSDDTLTVGRELYTEYCLNCHGLDGNKTINPLSRRFSKDKLKFGTDPYSMWKTITYGNGLMLPQSALLSPEERYHVVNYIREAFIRKPNPSQYYVSNAAYLKEINERAKLDADKLAPRPSTTKLAPGMIDSKQGRNMDYGPYVSHSIAYTPPKNKDAARFADTTERAMVIDLPGEHAVCYDIERFSVSGIWQGTIATTAKTHHTSYKGSTCLSPGGDVLYKNVDALGWALGSLSNPAKDADLQFKGHYLQGKQVLMHFEVGDRRVDELPSSVPGEQTAFTRTLRVGPGTKELFCLVGRLPSATADIVDLRAKLQGKDGRLLAQLTGATAGLTFSSDEKGGLWVRIPPTSDAHTFTVWYGVGKDITDLPVPEASATPDLDALMVGGPKRWRRAVHTEGVLAKPIEGYAADQLTVPLANPWGSWMRTTAFDFFSDGRVAISTLSGDVWLVRWMKDDLSDIVWTRYATGLYEPLGLRIVDDLVYVRGRDRITRLHDLNADGEADFYENFFQQGEIGPGYHAFQFDLQTDKAGNFYFTKSGRKAPHTGGVVRLSPDGKRAEMICDDFRHPNGLGAGGPYDWVTVADNPDGVAVFNGVAIVHEGARYGYAAQRTTPMLAVLPPLADSSSGGQCWSDPKRWGPLSGQMIHTSYSRLCIFYILTQNLEPHPNGFAIRMPFDFPSGVMRTRTNPVDGQVYVVGQKGWDTKAPIDGGLYRIRYACGPTHLITEVTATRKGLRFKFSCDLDPKSITKANFTVLREEAKSTKPVKVGDIRSIDARTVEVEFPDIDKEAVKARTTTDKKTGVKHIHVNWPIRVTATPKAADGVAINQTVYATINTLPKK